MKFFYTALTTDNKKITGVLDTPDRESAQGELHKMGVAILSVNEISEEEYVKFQAEQEQEKVQKGIRTFMFQATDTFGKDIEGSIDAMDDFAAYKRLREEYQFKVANLYVATATEEEKVRVKALIPGFEDQLKQMQAFTHKGEKKSAASQEKAESGDEVDEEIVAEIDRVIINTKKTLENHAGFFSTDLLLEIQNTLGELERVRTSNNIKHITDISNDLYTLISNPDKAEGDAGKDEKYQALLSEVHNSALVRKEFDMYKKAVEASGLKRVFGDVAKRLKETTESQGGEGEEPVGFVAKLKRKLGMGKKKKAPQFSRDFGVKKPKTKLGDLMEKLGGYFKATSPILKKTRQRELMAALKGIFSGRPLAGEVEAAEGAPETMENVEGAKKAGGGRKGRDFTGFLVEVDSFVGWLLCFYILYFFLVDFSLEKGIGLPREFVFKTLKTPLLVNVTLFLLLAHFLLRLKNRRMRGNLFAALFLFFLGMGAYVMVVVNF